MLGFIVGDVVTVLGIDGLKEGLWEILVVGFFVLDGLFVLVGLFVLNGLFVLLKPDTLRFLANLPEPLSSSMNLSFILLYRFSRADINKVFFA